MISNFFDFYLVVLFKSILGYFATNEPATTFQWSTILFYLFVKLVNIVLFRQTMFFKSIIYYRTLVQTQCLIYCKLLSLSPLQSKSTFNEGQFLVMFNSDCLRIGTFLNLLLNMFISIISLITSLSLLMTIDTTAASITFCLALIALSFQLMVMLQNGRIFEDLLDERDNRMKITRNTFFDIKTFKLLGWDLEFLKRVLF